MVNVDSINYKKGIRMKKIVELFHDIDCTLSPMISFYSALSD